MSRPLVRTGRVVVVTAAALVACGGESMNEPDPPEGQLVLVANQRGWADDTDGYRIELLGERGFRMEPHTDTARWRVEPGPYTLEVTGVDPTCSVLDGATRTVEAVAGEPTPVVFEIFCNMPENEGMAALERHRESGAVDIVIHSPEGVRVVTDGNSRNLKPTFSPDGTRIAFASDRGGDLQIWVSGVDGGGARVLTDLAGGAEHPDWAPEGGRIAFEGRESPGADGELYTIRPDGSGLTRLTDNDSDDLQPGFSPDGTRLVFVSDRDGNPDVYIRSLDGSSLERITETEDSREAWPSWWAVQPIRLLWDRIGDDAHDVRILQGDRRLGFEFTSVDTRAVGGPRLLRYAQSHDFGGRLRVYVSLFPAAGRRLVTTGPDVEFVSDWIRPTAGGSR